MADVPEIKRISLVDSVFISTFSNANEPITEIDKKGSKELCTSLNTDGDTQGNVDILSFFIYQ